MRWQASAIALLVAVLAATPARADEPATDGVPGSGPCAGDTWRHESLVPKDLDIPVPYPVITTVPYPAPEPDPVRIDPPPLPVDPCTDPCPDLTDEPAHPDPVFPPDRPEAQPLPPRHSGARGGCRAAATAGARDPADRARAAGPRPSGSARRRGRHRGEADRCRVRQPDGQALAGVRHRSRPHVGVGARPDRRRVRRHRRPGLPSAGRAGRRLAQQRAGLLHRPGPDGRDELRLDDPGLAMPRRGDPRQPQARQRRDHHDPDVGIRDRRPPVPDVHVHPDVEQHPRHVVDQPRGRRVLGRRWFHLGRGSACEVGQHLRRHQLSGGRGGAGARLRVPVRHPQHPARRGGAGPGARGPGARAARLPVLARRELDPPSADTPRRRPSCTAPPGSCPCATTPSRTAGR